ncbi:hypothetical protein E4U55_000142 [Claviceps digitariae]|nr:hypothetical protein E4U55_000142 [Claviceps digitariae]
MSIEQRRAVKDRSKGRRAGRQESARWLALGDARRSDDDAMSVTGALPPCGGGSNNGSNRFYSGYGVERVSAAVKPSQKEKLKKSARLDPPVGLFKSAWPFSSLLRWPYRKSS